MRWQKQERASRGMEGSPTGRVFTTRFGESLDAANVRRDFEAIVKKAGLKPEWTPREFRHSFVSLLSDHGIPLERIALLAGHSSQATTEAVYRKQLRPVITQGAEAMDDIFAEDQEPEASEGEEESDAVARSNSFGALFGPPSTSEAAYQSWYAASDQRRGGGI